MFFIIRHGIADTFSLNSLVFIEKSTKLSSLIFETLLYNSLKSFSCFK